MLWTFHPIFPGRHWANQQVNTEKWTEGEIIVVVVAVPQTIECALSFLPLTPWSALRKSVGYKRRSWRERDYGRGMGMRSKLLPIWVHLAKSEKTDAQSGLVGLGDKRIVAHFQVPSALASVASCLERASQVPRIPTCLLKWHPHTCQLGEPPRHRPAENSQDNWNTPDHDLSDYSPTNLW